jgi:predicted N-acetyltransferase YhbS
MTGVPGAVIVRPAVTADLPALTEALGRRHRFYFADRIRRQPALGILLVAVKGGDQVVGSVFLRLAPAEEWELRERLPRVPVLSRLEVVAAQQRNGVGRQLVQAAEDEARARGRARILLGVRAGDRIAEALYSSLGYERWPLGPVNAMVETYDADGTRRFGTERCAIMIKELGR